MSDNGLWDEHAQWWIDGFTNGAGRHRVLDLGCGDGQIARALAAQGSDVLGVDPTQLHIDIAIERGGGPRYLLGGATDIPADDNSFDAVVACLVFEHIDQMDEAMTEVARVLKPQGQFSFFLNHPLLQTPGSGWIDDHIIDPPEQYWRIGPYLVETESIEEVEKDVYIRFIHRPLSRYVNTLIANGMTLERMVEPSPPPGFLARAPEYALAHTIPRLLYLRSTKQ